MEHIRTAKESGFLFDWSSGWLASDEVAREIQPVKNERKVFPTVENVNDLGARKTLVSKKSATARPHARGSNYLKIQAR